MKGKEGDFSKVYKQVGKRLTGLRKAAGYSSAFDFAYEIEMVPSQYAAYERGQNLKLDTLLIILKGLKTTLTEFFAEGFD